AAPFSMEPGSGEVELLIHFASITHAVDPEAYRRVNLEGSLRLVDEVRQRGCRRMLYVSTRCVGPSHRQMSCGAYADSKRALEEALMRMEWTSLAVIRPAEVYGAGGAE